MWVWRRDYLFDWVIEAGGCVCFLTLDSAHYTFKYLLRPICSQYWMFLLSYLVGWNHFDHFRNYFICLDLPQLHFYIYIFVTNINCPEIWSVQQWIVLRIVFDSFYDSVNVYTQIFHAFYLTWMPFQISAFLECAKLCSLYFSKKAWEVVLYCKYNHGWRVLLGTTLSRVTIFIIQNILGWLCCYSTLKILRTLHTFSIKHVDWAN